MKENVNKTTAQQPMMETVMQTQPSAAPQTTPMSEMANQMPVSQGGGPPAGEASKSGSKTLMWIMLGAIVLVIIVAVVMLMSQSNQPQLTSVVPTRTQEVMLPSPTLTPTDEQAINQIDPGDVNTDMKDIDKDVSKL